jgi:small subunit ribosomal protein S19e
MAGAPKHIYKPFYIIKNIQGFDMTVRDVDAEKLILKAAEELSKMEELRPPAWSPFVKTGVSRQRPPTQENWWNIRQASILRKLYLGQKGVGVSRMRTIYGSRKNRGHKPEHSFPASGSIIRKSFQQLEKAGFVKTEKGEGRLITPKGQKFLNSVAKQAKQ